MTSVLVEGRSLRLPGHEITWAGHCPWTSGPCFGTEDGEILVCRASTGDALDVLPYHFSNEAVNGVAFWRDFVGISTRSDVVVARRGQTEPVIKAQEGAHGILALHSGLFFAPMGISGVLRIEPGASPGRRLAIERPSHGQINFYKLVALDDQGPGDLMACASRNDGLLSIRAVGDAALDIRGWASRHADFIDVCSIASDDAPRAVAGLCLDGSLVLLRDLLAEEEPRTIRLAGISGTPYSILSAGGNLLVLTSQMLISVPDLLPWFLGGGHSDGEPNYRFTSVQAVDAFLISPSQVAIVLDDEVRLLDFPVASHASESRASNGRGADQRLQNEPLLHTWWTEAGQRAEQIQQAWDKPTLVMQIA